MCERRIYIAELISKTTERDSSVKLGWRRLFYVVQIDSYSMKTIFGLNILFDLRIIQETQN